MNEMAVIERIAAFKKRVAESTVACTNHMMALSLEMAVCVPSIATAPPRQPDVIIVPS
jgi:hypothetical protein